MYVRLSTMQTPASTILYTDKQKFYRELASDLRGFLEKNWLMNLANFSALLNQHLPEINWIGFYLATGEELRLGPFQGLPACTRIPFGKGVCGTSAASKKIIVVDDVDQFPGHIVCDGKSKSEIVIPLVFQNRLLGVLDIDSPVPARFDDHDRQGLESLTKILSELTDWPAHF